MNSLIHIQRARTLILWCSLVLLPVAGSAQVLFTGTNQPGTGQNFSFSLSAGATNLALRVPGDATAYSHLLLRAGVAPTDTDYDYIASINGQTNSVNLESPEFKLTNYFLRVRTPAGSLVHGFTVTMQTNVLDLRTTNRPVTKSLVWTNSGSINSGVWQFFRVEITTNLSGWRILLSSTTANPDLYIQRDQLPTASTFLKRSQNQTNDIVAFAGTELTPGAYFIGVFQPSGSATYTLRTEIINFTTLNWDPGLTHLGTQVYTNTNTLGGDFYFKITAQNTSIGAWRTALNVSSGDAQLYLDKGAPPSPGSNLYKSERAGSDGFVVPGNAFNAGEDWYFMVHADAGAQWNLVSGEPFVADLGVIAADGSSGSGSIPMGAEGLRFFKTTAPANTIAWRLWLNGMTNSILVKKGGVPVPAINDLSQPGQMLVVPTYLVGGQLYFVGVAGNPAANINLDSRLQPFTDIPFSASTNVTVSGFPYTTFRVQVPVDQIAWQVNVLANSGNPNVALRRNLVPNESNNDAYSEVPGNVTDSILLVPPTLSDGTFYVTVYSTNNHSFTLQTGTPEITEINFTGAVTNADTNRVGWRLFQLNEISQQLGMLGWDLFLTNFAPGTRIALRRNAAPGIWTFRNPGQNTAGVYDFLSTAEFLQRPAHQADVWYVGVYNPSNALGAFTLVTRELTADPLTADGGMASRASVPAGKWQFFRVDIPTNTLGWDLRLTNVTSGQPQIVVRREALPTSLGSIGFPGTISQTNWPNGNQWVAASDWSGRNFSPDGITNESGRILTMGYSRPLEAATYYIGVLSGAGSLTSMTYTVSSRLIGPGNVMPVTELSYVGGAVTNFLPAREVAVYSVVVPSNSPSWKVKLTALTGDVSLTVAKDHIPNVTAANNGNLYPIQTAGKKMLKNGNEHFVLLPSPSQTNLGGLYYLVVASEGLADPAQSTRIGASNAVYRLESIGPMPEIDLGTLANEILLTNALEGGESLALHFHNSPETLGFELTLENRTGIPTIVSRGDPDLADPGAAGTGPGAPSADAYGNDGGQIDFLQASGQLITVADPFPTETIMLKARGSGATYSNATFRLRIRNLVPIPISFDFNGTNFIGTNGDCSTFCVWGDGGGGGGGGSGLLNICSSHRYEFFSVEVPTNVLGWDCRVGSATGSPQLIIGRDFLPLNTSMGSFNPATANTWPTNTHWIADKDWTQRSFSANGTNEDARILAMGMGRPLVPGQLFIAVLNPNFNPDAPAPMCYTLRSRGIGEGYTIPVVDLPFSGGSATNVGLLPREAAYYRVVIPTNATSWQSRLTMTSGDALFVTLTNSIPSVLTGRGGAASGKAVQKTGNEHYVSLPFSTNGVTPGTNFIAIVSEGVVVTNQPTRVGTNSSSFVIESRGELQVVHLGTVGASDLTNSGTLDGGEVRAYQFVVPPGLASIEVRLTNQVGIPVMVFRSGSGFPDPGASSTTFGSGSVGSDTYGNDGGLTISSANGDANTNLITIANPVSGTNTVFVKARQVNNVYPPASYSLSVHALDYINLNADGGIAGVTNQASGAWRYFRVDIPTNALGWDVRIMNVITGQPRIVVRRDLLPNALSTGPWGTPSVVTNWPTTNQWAPGGDWTRRTFSADNVFNEDNRILAVGMGQPLEPGTYYVGVINNQGSSPMSYSVMSRLIGTNTTIPVTDLNFSGGTVTNSGLLPRDAAYYRVTVPTNTAGWKFRLVPSAGEVLLIVLKDRVPNIDSGRSGSPPLSGKLMQKAGNEHCVLLPSGTQTNLPAGTYFIAVVGEGVNPASSSRIGTDSSAYTLTSEGAVTVTNLGTIGPADLLSNDALQGGETRFYRFNVPNGTPAFEMRLENRVGIPFAVIVPNTVLPDPGASAGGTGSDNYGSDGGATVLDGHTAIVTVSNPTNAVFTVAVKARGVSGVYPDSTYTLRVRQVITPDLNFTSELNTNGLNNVATGLLLDNQRAFYRVIVPANVNGAPVNGWELNVAQSSGLANVRVRKDLLPSDSSSSSATPFTGASAVIVPTYLTPGTWYVEVRGNGSTAFTLTSRSVVPERPAWVMPGIGEPSPTPGLTAPEFGDSGIDTNGVPLPDDQGIDLEQGQHHFYAVTVPTNNSGLLRIQLDAISGNPDLYIRTLRVPTASHGNSGGNGTVFDRSLAGASTEYGNWVPLDGKSETKLQPGTWFLVVRAVGNANARYRLRLSTGQIQDLDFYNGNLINQNLAGGDWRYYRVQVPLNLPANWLVSFTQPSGDVVMYLRDLIPPGQGSTTTDYRDWSSDNKNIGPYFNFDNAGTYSFSVPPVQPGATYFIGFRAKVDSTFTVGSTVAGVTNPPLPTINFYGGSATNTIPGFSQVAYRIYTPLDALRWRHTATNSGAVRIYIENGTMPGKTFTDDYNSGGGVNVTLDRFLNVYPWLPNQNYFLIATNTSPTNQLFVFNLNGGNNLADDDGDGLPDAWEVLYFNGISAGANDDVDGDTVINLNEYLEGTNPNDRASYRARLNLVSSNGVVNVNPASSNYALGTALTLTATPNAGYQFIDWRGSVTGNSNPLLLTMNTNKYIAPRFRVPADDFDQRIALSGYFASYSGLQNSGASKESGEPNHAGNAGGKSLWWTWTAPASAPVTITTAGSGFRNMLGVYTGLSVSNLTVVATNLAGLGTNTSQVTFNAQAGTVYQIAVDGFSGASGNVAVNLAVSGIVVLTNPQQQLDGYFHFTIIGPPGQVLRVEASTTLASWTTLATVTNVTGTLEFTDTSSPNFSRRYYRVKDANAPVSIILANPTMLPNGQFAFTINSAEGQVLQIVVATNLSNWTPLATVTNTTGTNQYIDPSAASIGTRFYRAFAP